MSAIDNLKKYCRDNRIPLSRIERALGYGNGSLSKTTVLTDSRLVEIAEYLGISTDYLLGREKQEIRAESPALKKLIALALNSEPEDIELAYLVLKALDNRRDNEIT